jgi:hypothetical protein
VIFAEWSECAFGGILQLIVRTSFHSMQPKPIPLLAVLVLLAGGAAWLAWGRTPEHGPASHPGSATSGGTPAESAPASVAAAKAEDRDRTRTPAAPQARPAGLPPAAEPPAPSEPLPGAGVAAIYGGAEAFQDFYRSVDTDGRRSRLQELESVLAEYHGDPTDRREFDKYQALKDELEWLRAHPDS